MNSPILSADIQLIQRILPHRYPFLLVDKVLEIDGYKSATGIKNVSTNEPHFQGHFPGAPIMPGVTIVEAMAQTAGVMVGTALDLADKNMLIYFMAIDKCKFRDATWRQRFPIINNVCPITRSQDQLLIILRKQSHIDVKN